MFDLKLFLNLVIRTFSTNRNSLRYPAWKRIRAVIIIFPLFIFQALVNNLFLLLDEIIFPRYRKIRDFKTVFIVGIPRSATTFLLELMAADERNFTCFRLWELVLAPSILQKYFFLMLLGLDKKTGRHLYRFSLWLDKKIFGRITGIHKMGFSLPEEDEALMLHIFSSVYLTYFFPEVESLEEYVFFDEEMSEAKKQRKMGYYYRCIQRHNYVFNPTGERYYLSKNPSFTRKMSSIAVRFPEAKVIYLLRSPVKTIPATISLNANLYQPFCRLPVPYPLVERTRNFVIRWYQMAERALHGPLKDRYLEIPFRDLTRHPDKTVGKIYQYLGIAMDTDIAVMLDREAEKSRQYRSKHQYDTAIGVDEALLNRELPEVMQRVHV